jgi:CubicO group peptidase (beta-lactamase class C family)
MLSNTRILAGILGSRTRPPSPYTGVSQRSTLARFTWLALLAGLSCSLFGAQAPQFPDAEWLRARPAEAGLSEARLQQARDYALTGGGSGMIIRRGKLVMEWGDTAKLYDLKSSSKSIGVTLLGLAIKDGKVQLDDPAIRYQPTLGIPPESNAATGWLPKITLRQLANQVAGFEKPGGYGKLLFEPGTKWHYSDAGPNWLAECLTRVYGRDLNEVMFERVFTPIGIEAADIRWRNNSYRPHEMDGVKRREFGSGFHANVDAMARIGYLYLREGKWKDQQIIPAEFVRLARRPAKEIAGLAENESNHGNASEHYSLLWWNNGDGTIPALPRDAFWSWGLFDSTILVIPSLDIVAARAGQSWKRTSDEHYDVLKPFFENIALATRAGAGGHGSAVKPSGPPYPKSSVIKEIKWAPPSTIIRRAKGGDNWPMTWADDGALYTAYGDGNGFEPFVPAKLSIGFSKVTGMPPTIQGVNFTAQNGEFRGDGRSGRKASGLLMVDGVLYLLARNLDNAALAWSRDHGATWTWADWKFTTSFGAPTFLNFGKNYAGARDNYVYIYSLDGDSAYEASDRMVMARVPKNQITERAAYEYFVALDSSGQPTWSKDIAKRGAVFTHRGNAYRSGITYNAGLKRYLWCQILPHSTHPQGMRFQGGFGIYDAPEPWGPWTTAFYTENWDVGPGESSSLPTKWMSEDGKTVHLVFSGDDHFSVRQATIVTD